MLKVAFHDVAEVSNELLKFAVIVSAQDGKYIFLATKSVKRGKFPADTGKRGRIF